MKLEEMSALVSKYFDKEGYVFPDHFEHRFEKVSSAMLYSMIREYKPKTVLEVGSSHGGSGCIIMSALLKNDQPFEFYSSEIDDDLRKEAEGHIKEKCGQAPIMLGDITKELDKIPELDFLFVDNDHDLPTTKWIVKNLFPLVKKGGIYAMHDWPVVEEEGVFLSKDSGRWPETDYLMGLHTKGRFPFKKLFWTWKVTGEEETGFWVNI